MARCSWAPTTATSPTATFTCPIAGSVGIQVQGAATRRGEDRVIGGTPERRDESLAGKLGWNAGPDHSFLAELGYYRQTVTATAGKTVATSATVPTGMENVQAQRRYVGSISHSGRWGFATSESYLQLEDAKSLQDGKRIKNTIAQSIWMVPLPANALSVGAYYRKEDLTDTVGNLLAGSTRDGARRRQVAVFAENELTVLTGLRLTGGLRMDDDQQYGTHWTPRVYAVWNIDRAFTLKGGYSQGFRAPNLRQTRPDWGQSSRGGTIYGNPDLEAETSRTIEAGLLFDGGTFQASMTAYDTRFDNKITRVTCVVAAAWCSGEPLSSIGRPPTTYVNVDKAKVRGIEATIDVPLTSTLRVNATGTLTDSEQLSGANIGAALNDTPKQQASASLNWKPTTRLSGYIRGIFRGEEAITEAQISGNATVAPSYTTVDIGASYKVSPRFTLHGGVQNVLDKRLSYDRFGYVIDPARIWLGIGTRF